MTNKVAIVAMTGEMACFVHVMLNGLDMLKRGFDVKIIIEGKAPGLVKDLISPDAAFAPLYAKTKGAGLIDCVCRACAKTMGALAVIEEQGLPLCDEMSGHPSLARYIENGYQIITL